MSSSDPDVAQEILDSFSRILVENYCIIASSVLLFADTLTTFTDEVERIWRRRFTGATLVFLITRYAAVAERIVLVTSVFLPTLQDKSCAPVLRMDDALTDISYLIFGVFMTLRARGIWGEGWMPIALLVLLTPVRTIITIYVQANYIPIAFGVPLYGCGAVFNLTVGTIRALGIASRASSISIDIVVLVLTWVRTLRIKRESSRLGLRTPIITLLLRDGTIYFLIILFIQTFSIVSAAVGASFVLWDVWPYFDQVFTVIFCCRFMLDLRGVYLQEGGANSLFTETTASTIYFSTHRLASGAVGNLGAPLETFTSSARDAQLYSGRAPDSYSEGDSETLEVSVDPLAVGLHHQACIELLETPPAA